MPAPSVLDPEALRVQLEHELGRSVQRVEQPVAPYVTVEVPALAQTRVAFVRADNTQVERRFDLSTTADHALETIALVSANLIRDEAADLLASLPPIQAAQPEAVVPPVPVVAEEKEPEPVPAPAKPREPRGCDPNALRRVTLGGDFVPYLGSSMVHGTRVERQFSLNAIGGITGGLRGVELALGFNMETVGVCGAQIALGANLVRGPVEGVSLSMITLAGGRVDGAQLGLVEVAGGTVKGAQLGLVEVANGDVQGVQGGLVNFATGWVHGGQLGLTNVATSDIEGIQAGLANVTTSTLIGPQLGLANVSIGAIEGVQLGLVNFGGDQVQGLQLGLLNITTRKMRGAMIGLVNAAQDVDAPIGLFNILWNGRTHLDVWATDAGQGLIGIEHGGRYVHNILGLGFGSTEGHGSFSVAYGIGVRPVSNERVFFDVDLLAYGIFAPDSDQNEVDVVGIGQLRLPVSFRLSPLAAIFAGPAINVSWGKTADNALIDPALYKSIRLTNEAADSTVRIWPGFTLGARFL